MTASASLIDEDLHVGWFIPTSGDTTAYGDREASIPPSMELFERVARAAEAAGLEYALVPVQTACWEAWITCAMVAAKTERLTMLVAAHMLRMTRSSVLAIMSQPYIEMAFLKGMPRSRVILRHALPNAAAPIISVIALNLAYLIVGVVVIEVVFVYPGVGQYMVDGVTKRDLPVVQACGLLFAATFIILNTVADVLAILANPRLRKPTRGG